MPTNYLDINKNAWNKRTAFHVDSQFYRMNEFLEGKTSLREIELSILGDIRGKSILHLQCHFGQDSLSLARMGGKVTGVDFSEVAIEKARELSKITGASARFICCDLYDLPNHLDETFDIVFTSYGTIGWLPDIHRWAGIVAGYLKPGGQFVFVEFHPVVWMYDNSFQNIEYRYFNTGPIHETESGTYADTGAPIEYETVGWNHGLGEVTNALLTEGLELISLCEYDYSPYDCFRNMEEFEPGRFRIKPFENKVPLVYSIEARKKPGPSGIS